MKLQKYADNKENPAIKGNLTAEEIVRTFWERNYKKTDVSFVSVKLMIKSHVDSGGDVFRLRNTIILITPDDDYEEVEFHTFTADPSEVYQSLMLMFFLGLNKSKGTQTAFTYTEDKRAYRMASKLVGKDYVELEKTDNPDLGKYVLTLDIGSLELYLQRESANKEEK
jgi:hypothetical protein